MSSPRLQTSTSATFKSPPLDGSLFLPELCDWHGKHSPTHELFVYAKEDGVVESIKWSEASRSIRRGAQMIRERIGQDASEGTVVAILSPSGASWSLTCWYKHTSHRVHIADSIPYATTILSIMRANCVAFPISTRNSAAAVAHLINQTGVSHILVGHEQAMQDLVERSLEALRTQHGDTPRVTLSLMPTFEELYSDEGLNTAVDIPWKPQGPDTPSLILHSSGKVHSGNGAPY